jgi:hypothetical protein
MAPSGVDDITAYISALGRFNFLGGSHGDGCLGKRCDAEKRTYIKERKRGQGFHDPHSTSSAPVRLHREI